MRSGLIFIIAILFFCGCGKSFDELLIDLSSKDISVRLHSAYQLAKMDDDRAINALLNLLKDENPNVRAMTAYLMREKHIKRSSEALFCALGDKDPNVVTQALISIGEIGDTENIDPIMDLLKIENKSIRSQAARVLGELGNKEAIKVLTYIWKNDSDASVRIWAAYSLCKLEGNQDAFEFILSNIDADRENRARCEAVWALGDLGDPRSVSRIISALEYTEWFRYWANIALRLISKKDLGKNPDRLEMTYKEWITWQREKKLE